LRDRAIATRSTGSVGVGTGRRGFIRPSASMTPELPWTSAAP
jgi:hypothetical protein